MADGLLSSGLGMIDRAKQTLAARFGLLASNPEEFARQLAAEQRQRAGVGLLGEPKTAQEMASGAWINTPYGQQTMEAGSGFAGSIMPIKNISKNQFELMASKGNLRQARTFEQDLSDVKSGLMPATKFDIPLNRSVSYESGDFVKDLKKAGLHVYDDKMGTVIAGKDKKAIEMLKNANTPMQYGLGFGYSPEDIAKFYVTRRGGDINLGYEEFINDLKSMTPKR